VKKYDLSNRQVENIVNGKIDPMPPRRPCKVVRSADGVNAAHTPAAPARAFVQ
jgi:hypothetical protein